MIAEDRDPMFFNHESDAGNLPPQVRELPPREREIARIVYVLGPTTARDIEERLSVPVTNATVRTVLNRLIRKGIVQRRKLDNINKYLYAAAITDREVKQVALRQLSQDYFDGSLVDAAAAMLDLLRTDASAGTRRSPPQSPRDVPPTDGE